MNYLFISRPYRVITSFVSGDSFIIRRDELQTGLYIFELSGTNSYRGKLIIE
jgi:hypothetical protein